MEVEGWSSGEPLWALGGGDWTGRSLVLGGSAPSSGRDGSLGDEVASVEHGLWGAGTIPKFMRGGHLDWLSEGGVREGSD